MTDNFQFFNGTLVDLTHDYSEKTLYWPTGKGFKLHTEFNGFNEKGYFYSAKSFSAPEHGGTHIDAPIHFLKDGETVDKIPLEKLIGNGIVIDVSNKCLKDSDYEVSVDDVKSWESEFGMIPPQTIVFLNTGFGELWPNRMKYLGTDKIGSEALSELSFPGLKPETAKWIVENRKINAIGIDTQSIDYGKSQFFETHRILCSSSIPFFENVANLKKLPSKNFFVIALPMKIKDGSGAPVRLIGIV